MEQREEATAVLGTENPETNAEPDLSALPELIAQAKEKIEAGELEEGVSAFREIAERFPEIPEVFNNLGAICAAMGKRAEAEEAFGRASELSPESANSLYNRGLMRFQGGNFLGALADFEAAAERSPADAEIHNNVGVTHFQLGRFAEAEAAFERALEQRPDYTQARLNLVDVDLVEQRPDSALERCEALLTESPSPEVHQKLAECRLLIAARALDQATDACETALEVMPENEELRWRLGAVAEARETLLSPPQIATPAT